MPMLFVLSTLYGPSTAPGGPPSARQFALSREYRIDDIDLFQAVQQHCVSLQQSPEATITRLQGETKAQYT